MDSHLGWHSECSNGSGVMMINTHHKSNTNFDEELGKFGEQLMNLESNTMVDEIGVSSG